MSQFGTIGTPRMHPCMAHPSCSQFNAHDIIRISTGKDTNHKNILIEQESAANDEEGNIFAIPKSVSMQTTFNNALMRENSTTGGVTEEENRRYIEVSPGVWSY